MGAAKTTEEGVVATTASSPARDRDSLEVKTLVSVYVGSAIMFFVSGWLLNYFGFVIGYDNGLFAFVLKAVALCSMLVFVPASITLLVSLPFLAMFFAGMCVIESATYMWNRAHRYYDANE